jgi:PAS domain S-box-containing protein
MELKNSQFTIIQNELKSTPLLPWEMVKNLLWDLEIDVFSDLEKVAVTNDWHFKYFIDGFTHFKGYSIVLTDHNLNICVASSNIESMTGYDSQEMIGHKPSLLQGQDTDENCKFLLKIAIDEEVPFNCRLVNYRKNGDAYGCEIHAFPIYNGLGSLSHYIAFENEYYV